MNSEQYGLKPPDPLSRSGRRTCDESIWHFTAWPIFRLVYRLHQSKSHSVEENPIPTACRYSLDCPNIK